MIVYKEGYDYGLKKELIPCPACSRSISKPDRWWCVIDFKYLKEECDIFQIDKCERETQLEKNWRKRYKEGR